MQKYLITEDNADLYTANIKAIYYQALQYPSLAEEGLNWYVIANQKAEAIANRFYMLSLPKVCGVIAALSPNNRWERNLIDAELLLKHAVKNGRISDFKTGTYDRNKGKAWMIAHGASPLEVLGGNKVRAFYQCLLNPQNQDTVCVDSHAINIALGRQAPIAHTPTLTPDKFKLLAGCYCIATQEINADSLEKSVLPLQVQSATWAYYRVLRGLDARFSIAA